MIDHYCPEGGCLFCMVNDLYKNIENLTDDNIRLAKENVQDKKLINELRKITKQSMDKGKK